MAQAKGDFSRNSVYRAYSPPRFLLMHNFRFRIPKFLFNSGDMSIGPFTMSMFPIGVLMLRHQFCPGNRVLFLSAMSSILKQMRAG